MTLINARRLRDYPKLMLFTTWLILGVNLVLHQGWMGAFGQVIGGDFIMFYSSGLIYRSNPDMIYDYNLQNQTQQALVSPTILPGYNPYMNPPYVAPLYSLLTFLPLQWAFIVWTILAILSVFLSVFLLYKLELREQSTRMLPFWQLIIIILSFFPFIEGLQSGQNHWLTLLLVTGVTVTLFKKRWYLSGALAGLLIYKPQFVLGFIILWIIWKNYKALLSFGLVACAWVGLFALANGTHLFRTYLQMSRIFMELPYLPGFPNYLLVTFYGLLTSIFPPNTQVISSLLSQILLLVYACGLVWLAYKSRKSEMAERIPVIVAALIFPLLATPYALLHDMVILIPAFVLWIAYNNSRAFTLTAVTVYLGAFFLTFIAAITKIALVSLLVIGLFGAISIWVFKRQKSSILENQP